jgi:hypothetical protein
VLEETELGGDSARDVVVAQVEDTEQLERGECRGESAAERVGPELNPADPAELAILAFDTRVARVSATCSKKVL